MLSYDFRDLLSSFEFECFARDLINAQEKLDLANFAEGRDGGVDLRCSYGKGKTVIVQAKRYIHYKELKPELKKEVEKVKLLKPNRYMLVTSVDLTPANKKEIMGLFTPFIKKEGDIWAKQDLNKILALHPDVERRYYKLWLASTNVLNSILNKNIVNWTSFEKDEMQGTIRTYVMNDSFNEALSKLLENRYVVISGEPGIGKTTLARVLVMHLLSDKFTDTLSFTNFEEFYYTNSNIDDLAKVMQTGKRQVFFYDDFMGQITFQEGEKNFDSRIIKFINACQREKDKLFILTTREYILQQGLTRYGRFKEGRGIEMSKCVVDMGKYTRFVRAQILYNHLVANQIPQEYINSILQDKNYLKIIDHPHFSPRIIETFLTQKTHELCKPEAYFDKIKGFFDHPDSVWLDAFGRLSTVEQEALLVLATTGTPVMYDMWKDAYTYFFEKVHKENGYLNDSEWEKAVKVLQDNFIKIGKDRGGIHVDFHNPGVFEVLARYIGENEHLREVLLENAYFVEQAFGALRNFGQDPWRTFYSSKMVDQFFDVFDRLWKDCRSCRTVTFVDSADNRYISSDPRTRAEVLYSLLVYYEELVKTRPGYGEQKVTERIMTDRDVSIYFQLKILEHMDVNKTTLDLDALFSNYLSRLYNGDDCLEFISSINKVFPTYSDYLESKEFCSIVVNCLQNDLKNTKDSDLENLDSTVDELCQQVPFLGSESVVYEIRERKDEFFNFIDSKAEAYQDDFRYESDEYMDSETLEIDNLFATIRKY